MTDQISNGLFRVTDENGDIVPGALVYFYASGTTTEVDIYADSGGATPLANPVVADSGGRMPQVFFSDGVEVKQVYQTAEGATIAEIDPVPRSSSSTTGADGISIAPFSGIAQTELQAALEAIYAAATGGANPSFTGTASAERLLATNTTAPTATSTDHAIQAGQASGQNIRIGSSAIQSVNDDAASDLELQPDGGAVNIPILKIGGSIVTAAASVINKLTGWTGTATDLNKLDGDELTNPRLRLTSIGDVSLASTGHAFQIGLSTATNIALDNNEFQGRNNGVASQVSINTGGGNVTLGDSASDVKVPGRLLVDGQRAMVTPAALGDVGSSAFLAISTPNGGTFTNGTDVTTGTTSGTVQLRSACVEANPVSGDLELAFGSILPSGQVWRPLGVSFGGSSTERATNFVRIS